MITLYFNPSLSIYFYSRNQANLFGRNEPIQLDKSDKRISHGNYKPIGIFTRKGFILFHPYKRV